jgi:hypothetical protein
MTKYWLALLATVCLPGSVFAQSSETDTGEVAGFLGGAFGSIGSHGTVGASVGTATNRFLIPQFEVSYIPLGTDALQAPGPGVTFRNSRLYDFNGGVHIRVPLRDNLAPYLAIGGGLLYSTFESVTTDASGNSIVTGRDNKNFAFHIGGGVRYYLTSNIGVRPEFKVYVSDRNFTRLSVGIFYQFP